MLRSAISTFASSAPLHGARGFSFRATCEPLGFAVDARVVTRITKEAAHRLIPYLLTSLLRSSEICDVFRDALLLRSEGPEPPGPEGIVTNDVLMIAQWRVDRVVPWRGHSHINTLELGSIGTNSVSTFTLPSPSRLHI